MNSTDKFIRTKLLAIAAKYQSYFGEDLQQIFDFVLVNYSTPASIHVVKGLPFDILNEIEEIFWIN